MESGRAESLAGSLRAVAKTGEIPVAETILAEIAAIDEGRARAAAASALRAAAAEEAWRGAAFLADWLAETAPPTRPKQGGPPPALAAASPEAGAAEPLGLSAYYV